MTSCAWLWLYLGAFLMLMELMAPGFIIFFFGLSACTVGICRFIFGEAFSSVWQVSAFSVFSVLYIVLLRRLLKSVFVGDKSVGDEQLSDGGLAGRLGRVTEQIRDGLPGRVMVGDAEWNAVADAPIPAGTDVKVVSQNNLTIKVEVV